MARAPVTWSFGERSWHGGCDEIPLPRGPGRLWLCGKRFVAEGPEEALAAVDGTGILCLCERHELEERYPSYVVWLSSESEERATWFPIPDFHAPDLDDAVPFLAALRARIELGERLIMHCGAGIGRSGTMAAALLMGLGTDRLAATSWVAAHRPMAGPEVGAQQSFLVELAALLR
jgi:protein-tyrosine phosphatase